MKNRLIPIIASGFFLAGMAVAVHGAPTDLSDLPLVTSSSSDVHSNLMFVLDDSGSMAWNYLPDWANDFGSADYLRRNSAWNGVAYNPALRYNPPTYFNADGTSNTTTYPSMNGSSTATGADSGTKPNWKDVKRDGYRIQSTSNDNLEGNAYFYTMVPGEYCDSPSLRTCISASAPTGAYIYPASLRWCTGTGLTSCKATNQSDYNTPRYQTPFQATITLEHTGSSSSSTSISGITVGGVQILSSATSGDTSRSTVADRIRDRINACATGLSGNCGVAGYTATSSGNVVTIYAISATTSTPVVTIATTTDPMTATPTAFARQPVPNTSVTLTNGANLRTVIHSGNNSYPYPGTSAKAPARTDCAGTTCTYSEEMTNYANWYAYYQTRMQMMKTASSLAFAKFGQIWDSSASPPGLVTKTPLRVGFYTICASGTNATGTDFLNADEFSFPHKKNFYDKLFAGNPVCWTPLRGALSKAGQYYANKLTGQVDPVQYSCQRNVVMLSTDGYWNTPAESASYGPYQLDNATLVGNQDGAESRPYNDGATATVTETTPTTTVVRQQSVTTTSSTRVEGRNSYRLGPWGEGSCDNDERRLYTQPQQSTTTTSGVTTTTVDDITTISTRAVVTANGAVTSDTTSTSQSTTNVSTVSSGGSTTTSAWANVGAETRTNCRRTVSLPVPNPSTPVVISNDTTTTAGPTVTVLSTTGPTVGATTTTGSSTGGNSNSLADVAEYYFATDLRTSALGNCTGALGGTTDVCANNVKAGLIDSASWQHLTTYTLGLGVNGLMQYLPGYRDATTGDYYNLGTAARAAATASAANSVCPWVTDGASCTWPTPVAETQTAVDDLWHAAVNGRGTYFSASDAGVLAVQLANSLAEIGLDSGSSSAATTSNPNVTSGDNYVFESTFTEGKWFGELVRRRLNLYTGAVLPFDPTKGDWSAMDLLDSLSLANRHIYTFDSSNVTTKRRDFTWGNLTATEQGYFALARLSAVGGLTQFCASGSICLSSADQTAAAGQAVVDFLRGDRSKEGVLTDLSPNKWFRQRAHLLGDIVNAEAVYVKGAQFSYGDKGYSDFKTVTATRSATVYVAANDGMLHAFSAATGVEQWAFIPSFEISSLYQLADKNYDNQHKFFLDGTPVVGDICTSNCTGAGTAVWKTILVGGQNKGGRGYYALDITDPANPKVLWEFTNDNLGYTYGNPVISKLKTGDWVVMFASGYNNVTPGDGVGRLFVLNAGDGTLVGGAGGTISTVVGTTTDPSGLARISAWANTPSVDNTALWVYGGDLLGNLWRFDINGDTGASGYDAQLLATFKDVSSVAQPITAAPQLGDVNGKIGVFVGTGKYLGIGDATTTTQSFYGVKDNLTATGVGTPRTNANFVKQTMVQSTCGANNPYCQNGQVIRLGRGTDGTSPSENVDWATKDGWYFDLPLTNERAYTDPQLVQGTLAFTSNIPDISVCTAGGSSYLNFVDYTTGGAVEGSGGVVGVSLGNSLATRPVVAQLPNGKIVVLTRMSGGGTISSEVPVAPLPGATRRVSWRELRVDQ